MSTAIAIIRRSMRLLGVIGSGENVSAEEAQDGLEALNALMGSLSNNTLLISALTEDSHALTSGVDEYTIGPTGDIATVRPIKIDDSTYIDFGGLSYPLRNIGEDYNGIPDKSASGDIPEYYWYRATYPDASIIFYPIPGNGCTLHLWSWKQLQSFPTLTTQAVLPPGWEDLLAFNLAMRLAPEFEVEPTSEVRRQAQLTKKRIKRTNVVAPTLALPNAVLPRPIRANVFTDT